MVNMRLAFLEEEFRRSTLGYVGDVRCPCEFELFVAPGWDFLAAFAPGFRAE